MGVAIAIGVVVLAIVLFAIERIPTEVTALLLVVLLVVSGLLTPAEALGGFSSDTVIFIFTLLAMTQGLGATGVMDEVGRRLLSLGKLGPQVVVAVLLLVVCLFSSVASNTAVTAAFLPIATAVCARSGVSKREVLMPLAFASMLGGMIFLFGSSTNLVVSAEMVQLGLGKIGFAELTPLGAILAAVGLIVTVLGARTLLRGEPAPEEAVALDGRHYLAEVFVAPGSSLEGKSHAQLVGLLGPSLGGVVRDGQRVPGEHAEHLIPGDRVVLSGSREDILKGRASLVADRSALAKRGEPVLVEVAVPPTSLLVGRTLRALLQERDALTVLALHRHPALQRVGEDLWAKVGSVESLAGTTLAVGDVLLVSAPPDRLRILNQEGNLVVLGSIDFQAPRRKRALLAAALFASALVAAALGWTAPSIAGLCGLLAMIATGCVDTRTAFRIDWRVVILIGSLLALGSGVEKSGAGAVIAHGLVPLSHVVGPRGVLGFLMLLTVVLSIPMSNQAAALVMLPVAVHAAAELGLGARPFAIGICLAASCSFATPLEPSAALVFGPGGYRFRDFLRVGAPLTLLLLILLTVGVPIVWPFVAS